LPDKKSGDIGKPIVGRDLVARQVAEQVPDDAGSLVSAAHRQRYAVPDDLSLRSQLPARISATLRTEMAIT
jgi:hypothetical protein